MIPIHVQARLDYVVTLNFSMIKSKFGHKGF